MKWLAKTRSFKLSFKMFLTNQQILTLLLMVIALCATFTSSSPTLQQQNQQKATTIRVQQCREGCLEKFTTKDALCQQNSECLTCWEECSKAPPGKVNKTIRETWSLHTVSMKQEDSLVLVDVAWEQVSVPYQCLVTWEVAGGGLMGNLLTESFNVGLSLWPDTRYRVQVTCKNKITASMSRSLPLLIDTSEAVKVVHTTERQLQNVGLKQAKASYITNIPTTNSSPTPQPTTTEPSSTHKTLKELPVDNTVEDFEISPYRTTTTNRNPYVIYDGRSKKHNEVSDFTVIERVHKTQRDSPKVVANTHTDPILLGGLAFVILYVAVLMCWGWPWAKPSDKSLLLAEELCPHGVALPPPMTALRSVRVATTKKERIKQECKSSAMCSRDTLRV